MIGLLGAGKMGMSIINGIVNAKISKPCDINIYDVQDRKIEIESQGFNFLKSEKEVFEKSDIFIFAIKPQNFKDAIANLKNVIKVPRVIVTIAAGISLDFLKKELGDYNYVRVMPNTPALIGAGVSCIAKGEKTSSEDFKEIKQLFQTIGIVEEVNECMINEYTPLNGSFPAFFYYFIRDFVNAAKKRGMDEVIAKRLACETAISSAKMILSSNKSIDELLTDVCSPKGTTLAGLSAFDEYNVTEAVDECLNRCIARGEELQKA